MPKSLAEIAIYSVVKKYLADTANLVLGTKGGSRDEDVRFKQSCNYVLSEFSEGPNCFHAKTRRLVAEPSVPN